jgi:tetratricopeptide (TPR) repeat protein
MVVSLAVSVDAAKPRKLTVSAYLRTAKIEIISGDMNRYPYAIAMLDSLFMHYGPHAEALHLLSQISVDYMESVADPRGKIPHVKKMAAYVDSIHQCCDNDQIKRDFKIDCALYAEQADSTKVKFWRDFYNAGIAQIGEMENLSESIKQTPDSTMRETFSQALDATFDSCVANMEMTVILDSSDYRAYIGIGTAYQLHGEADQAIQWKEKGLRFAQSAADSSRMQLAIGYDYVATNDYCRAIPYLEAYVNTNLAGPADQIDTVTALNLTICQNNCGLYEQALATYHRVLAISPKNTDAMTGVGRYYNEMGRRAADSATAAAADPARVTQWQSERDRLFDSARTYFGLAFETQPENLFAAEMFAVLSAIDLEFNQAVMAFTKLTELEPDKVDHWIALGDCYVNLKQYEQGIGAYEKASELTPGARDLWEQLAGLYKQVGQTAKAAEAEKRLRELQ